MGLDKFEEDIPKEDNLEYLGELVKGDDYNVNPDKDVRIIDPETLDNTLNINFMENQIILINGILTPLSSFQLIRGLKEDQLSKHFSIKEKKIGEFQPFLYAAPLIELLEAFREEMVSPVIINSGFRTHEKQEELKKEGYRAATYSPHEQGMAFDIDTKTWKETQDQVAIISRIANNMKIMVRIGYMKYWHADKMTFFHIDVCPMYFAEGMPYHSKEHPKAWENEIKW